MSKHLHCRRQYVRHCQDAGIPSRQFVAFGPLAYWRTPSLVGASRRGSRNRYKVCRKNKPGERYTPLGEFVGCCAYHAKTRALIESIHGKRTGDE